MFRRTGIALCALLLPAAIIACSDDDTGSSPGLDAGGPDATTDATSSSSGGNDAGAKDAALNDAGPAEAGESGDSGAPVTTSTAYREGVCDVQKRCNNGYYVQAYDNDAPKCLSQFKASDNDTLPGLAKPTQAQLAVCGEALKKLSCTAYTNNALTVPACRFAGALPTDTACLVDQQCASLRCKRLTATDACGKCTPANEGAPCTNDIGCGSTDLFCKSSFCAKTIAKDAACVSGDACESGTRCLFIGGAETGKCAVPKDVGGDCSSSSSGECRFALSCTNGKCTAPTYVGLGESCGFISPTNVPSCAVGTCFPLPTGKCVPYQTEGMGCGSAIQPNCSPELTCNFSTKKCEKPAAVVCQ